MKILDKHTDEIIFEAKASSKKKLLEKAIEEKINLSEANLSKANLSEANLSKANLSKANLSEANLSWANLSWAYLSGADLSKANLSEANLSWANLSGANLSGANLSGANLSEANLSWANLSWADLSGANFQSTAIVPSIVLLCNWRSVSDSLCLELMRYDASNHPNPEKFDEWAKGGECPYGNISLLRCANFQEKRSLYTSGPSKSAYELMIMLFNEKEVKYED